MAILDIFAVLLKLLCPPGNSQEQQPQPSEPWKQQIPHEQVQQQHGGYPHGPSSPYHGEPGHPPHTGPGVSQPHHQPSAPPQDLNQVNQHNEHYLSLRARAKEEGDQMAKCFEQSHQAYSGGDGARAKELSNQGKDHERKMEALNKEASNWIFFENNKDSKPGEINLHGLFVKEAIAHTDQAIQEAKLRGDSEVHLIVGKGLHSPGGAAKIKPAIEELMQSHQLIAELDPNNAGVLIVHMGSRGGEGTRSVIGAEDIARRLEQGNEGCVIM